MQTDLGPKGVMLVPGCQKTKCENVQMLWVVKEEEEREEELRVGVGVGGGHGKIEESGHALLGSFVACVPLFHVANKAFPCCCKAVHPELGLCEIHGHCFCPLVPGNKVVIFWEEVLLFLQQILDA